MRYLILLLLLTGCASLKYNDPVTKASLEYYSFGKTAEDVQIVYTSPEKTVAVSLGKTANDPIFEQIGGIIKAYNIGDDK